MTRTPTLADVPKNYIDAVVADLCALAELRENDDDRYGLWTISGIAIAAGFYGLAAMFGTLRGASEVLLAIAAVALTRALIVRSRLARRFNSYLRLRERLERRVDPQLLWRLAHI